MTQILANQWRPQTFDEVIGQPSTVTAIRNALDKSLLHHCYLFSGTRGVGKTSLARLFAQGLNCSEGMSANPCRTCDSCKGIKAGEDLDCYEIDAASRTKVEETLKILDMANYPPTRSRFKIFLIDEVHMLSNHSFNALLKTLEQPPSYAKFLLATTEPLRIPDTVRSRCIQFQLQPVQSDVLKAHLTHVVEHEKKSIDSLAIDRLIQSANGSVRDAMTALQQVLLQASKDCIDLACVEQALGLVPQHEIEQLVEILQKQHMDSAMNWCQRLSNSQTSWSKLLDQWLEYQHQLLWDKAFSDHARLQNWIQISLLAKRDLALYPSARMAFEVMIARMLHCSPVMPKDWTKSIKLDQQVDANSDNVAETSTAQVINDVEKTQKAIVDQQVCTKEELASIDAKQWPKIVAKLKLTGMTNQLIQHMAFVSLNAGVVLLHLTEDKASLLNDKAMKSIHARLQEMGYAVKLDVQIKSETTFENVDAIKTKERTESADTRRQEIQSMEDFKRIHSVLDAKIID